MDDWALRPSAHEQASLVTVRFWVDPPYAMAKAMVVDAVAGANRCRSVFAAGLDVCTLVGSGADVEAVELLATSLLIQATAAMTGHGSRSDVRGRTRTRSFRQSFLLAFAIRIGERLEHANEDAVVASGRVGELVPLLARHQEHVDAALEEVFPHLVQRSANVSNGAGWAAGRAAADLAHLGVRGQVAGHAGGAT